MKFSYSSGLKHDGSGIYPFTPKEIGPKCGSRWLIGNGASIDVWSDRWWQRLSTFKIITPCPTSQTNMKVCGPIDFEASCWHEAVIKESFLQCDVKIIIKLPLCTVYLVASRSFNLAFSSKGLFFVRSTCDAIYSLRTSESLKGGVRL